MGRYFYILIWVSKLHASLYKLPNSPLLSSPTGGHGAQHSCTLCFLFPHQAKDHLSDLHHQLGGDGPLGESLSAHSHPSLLQWRSLSHLLLPAHLQLLRQHVLQHLVSDLHMCRPLPRHRAGGFCLWFGNRIGLSDVFFWSLNCLFTACWTPAYPDFKTRSNLKL